MGSLGVLKFNNYSKLFWQCRLGPSSIFEVEHFSSEKLFEFLNQGLDILLIDFYFSNISLEEEESIKQDIINACQKDCALKELYFLSPTYAGEQIRVLEISNFKLVEHNFSLNLLESLHISSMNYFSSKAS